VHQHALSTGKLLKIPFQEVPGFGIRIEVLPWFTIEDLSFVLFCEDGTEQNIEHEAAEGCKNNSGKLEADAVEVG
jgi:hypothetical protein